MYIRIGNKSVSLDELCCILGVQTSDSIEVVIHNGKGQSMTTTVSDNKEFPAVDIHGQSNGDIYGLARLELPNRDFPEDFTVRLYGGNENYEAGDWVALMKSNAFGKSVTGKPFSADDELTKIIYFDEELAAAKGLHDYGLSVPYDRLPEHTEDVED